MDTQLETQVPPLFTTDELAVLKRRLLRKGRDLAEILSELLAGQNPKATDLLDAKPGETKIEKVRRYLNQVDKKIKAIAAGTYGTCEGCGTALPYVALAELPWMDCCSACTANPA